MDEKHNLSKENDVAQELSSLKATIIKWYENDQREKRQKEKWLQALAIKSIIILASAIGVVWSGLEMGAWYLDQLQKREMAERYCMQQSRFRWNHGYQAEAYEPH